jgi:WD40 repeat protein
LDYSTGGDYVASGSADRTVRVFQPDREMAQRYFTSPPLPGIVTSVAFHKGGNLVVSGCDDGGVRLHTIDTPAVQLLGKFDAPARRPEFSPDGKYVLAASGDKTARMWPIVAPRELVKLVHPAPVTQATFRPVKEAAGYSFITCATNGEVMYVRLSDIDTSSPSLTAKVLDRHPGAALFATWSSDGQLLATVGGGEVFVWRWEGNAPVLRVRITGLHAATSRAEFSPDAKLLVTYGGDNLAHIWDLTRIAPP